MGPLGADVGIEPLKANVALDLECSADLSQLREDVRDHTACLVCERHLPLDDRECGSANLPVEIRHEGDVANHDFGRSEGNCGRSDVAAMNKHWPTFGHKCISAAA